MFMMKKYNLDLHPFNFFIGISLMVSLNLNAYQYFLRKNQLDIQKRQEYFNTAVIRKFDMVDRNLEFLVKNLSLDVNKGPVDVYSLDTWVHVGYEAADFAAKNPEYGLITACLIALGIYWGYYVGTHC